MTIEQLLQLYRSSQAISLAVWLGNPLAGWEAESCLACMRDMPHDGYPHEPESLNARLARLIARYWAGRDADMDYQTLIVTLGNSRDKAQLELCYGQLLIARKLAVAWRHLDSGFAGAANLLLPEEYFVVLNRHQRLQPLALAVQASGAASLDELLQEADVIRQFQGDLQRRRSPVSHHKDTVD